MDGSEDIGRCPPQAVGATWLPEMSLASWVHLPGGSVLQDFVGVTEAAAGVGRDLFRANLCSQRALDLRVTASYRLEEHQGSGERERGKDSSGPIHPPQDLLPWVLSGAVPGWGWGLGAGCFWLLMVAACLLL